MHIFTLSKCISLTLQRRRMTTKNDKCRKIMQKCHFELPKLILQSTSLMMMCIIEIPRNGVNLKRGETSPIYRATIMPGFRGHSQRKSSNYWRITLERKACCRNCYIFTACLSQWDGSSVLVLYLFCSRFHWCTNYSLFQFLRLYLNPSQLMLHYHPRHKNTKTCSIK